MLHIFIMRRRERNVWQLVKIVGCMRGQKEDVLLVMGGFNLNRESVLKNV